MNRCIPNITPAKRCRRSPSQFPSRLWLCCPSPSWWAQKGAACASSPDAPPQKTLPSCPCSPVHSSTCPSPTSAHSQSTVHIPLHRTLQAQPFAIFIAVVVVLFFTEQVGTERAALLTFSLRLCTYLTCLNLQPISCPLPLPFEPCRRNRRHFHCCCDRAVLHPARGHGKDCLPLLPNHHPVAAGQPVHRHLQPKRAGGLHLQCESSPRRFRCRKLVGVEVAVLTRGAAGQPAHHHEQPKQ